MSVLIETSKGDVVVDLHTEECPKACINFLKLCKIKYYNNCLFFNVQSNFIIQTGDPTNTGRGGDSIDGILYGEQARFFEDEIRPQLKHKKKGMVAMASAGENKNASQFYITTGEELASLDEKHTIFGEIAEGWDVIESINDVPCDADGRPLQNIRIRHTIILDDPFPDPPSLASLIPDGSPPPQYADDGRLEDDWVPQEETRPAEEIEKTNREKEAKSRAVVLEMIGDLPEADAAPPPNMLFICKLNPVTTEEDLEIIFSRFGKITSCDIIRDWKTGDSLCYGFLGFDTEKACEDAYFKMNNVLIDDRRIKVDFSQSVHHLWKQFRQFGRKGDVQLGKEADDHQRAGRGGGQLRLKEHLVSGIDARGGGGSGGGNKYSLILDEDDGEQGALHGREPDGGRHREVKRKKNRDSKRITRDEEDRDRRHRHHHHRGDADSDEGRGYRREKDRRRPRSRSRERRRSRERYEREDRRRGWDDHGMKNRYERRRSRSR